MNNSIEQLPDSPEELKEIILSLQADVQSKDKRINYLLEQFNLLRRKQFGSSSEVAPNQASLFDEAEEAIEQDEPEKQTIAEHKRHAPKRKPLPKDLPRETVIVDIAEEDKVCNCCGGELHQMGQETSEKLEFIPAEIKVIETIRPKYSCRSCEREGTATEIKIAPVPASPIPKSIATASLLAFILTSKYQYALPLYRMEQMFANYGIDIKRKTMSDWVMKCAAVLQPIFAAIKCVQLAQPVIHADETPVQVIHNDKQKSYMWVYCTGTDSPNNSNGLINTVLYDFQPSRAGRCPQEYLEGYQGYLQVDGYAGYEQTEAELIGCMAHVRRKFIEAQKAQPKSKTGKADWAINHIQKLYAIENRLKNESADEKFRQRETTAIPLLKQFKDWVDKSLLTVTPKSALGKALAYTINQWPKVIRYVEDGRLSIDNNRAERAVKPFVIGRKNWLFSCTERGATASAMIYSIIETAKANDVNPDSYLQLLLKELPSRDSAQSLDDLLPWKYHG